LRDALVAFCLTTGPSKRAGVRWLPYTFKFYTKSECSYWLKFQQLLIDISKQNCSFSAPAPRVTTFRPVKFSSYFFLRFSKDLVFSKLADVLSPTTSVAGHLMTAIYPVSTTLCTVHGLSYLKHP